MMKNAMAAKSTAAASMPAASIAPKTIRFDAC